MAKITSIQARQILNSKGQPTIEAAAILSDGSFGIASVPSGTSIGKHEALELRDANDLSYQGQSVNNAVQIIKATIEPVLLGTEATLQREIDTKMIELDGTPNKSKLGANSILAVSMAVSKAAAKSTGMPLFNYLRQFLKSNGNTPKIPTPMFNILNGGLHSENNAVNFQEFLVIPASSKSFTSALEMGLNIYSALKKTLLNNNLSTLIADEGGFSPKLATNQDALIAIKQSIEATSLRLGFDVFLGLDVSANHIFVEQNYHIKDKSIALSTSDLIDFYEMLNKDFHLLYLEDGLQEDDFEGWSKMTEKLSQQTIIAGDDITATNPYRLQTAIEKKAITGIIIKPNQIGSVIEALAVVEMAKESGLKIIVANRSAETNDDFIADFAVAVSADYCKFGAVQRGERLAKYNRLLQIEQQLKTT